MSKSSWRLTEGDDIAAGLLAMSRLGGGHAYEAYLAWSEPLHAHVVVKVIRPEQVDDSRTLRSLRREVAMLKRLEHPVIVRSFGAQPDGARPHVILEHLDGPRLSTLLRRYGPLPMEQLLPLALQICSALHYLAGQGVAHLDIKPSNIIMGSSPRLIDFSIARTVEEAAGLDHVAGTDDFLSPEQCAPPESGIPGTASDIWGLGATMFLACSGYLPFDIAVDHHKPSNWTHLLKCPAPLPRSVPQALVKPVLSCLEWRPEHRPTAAELASELEPLVAALPKPVLGGLKLRR